MHTIPSAIIPCICHRLLSLLSSVLITDTLALLLSRERQQTDVTMTYCRCLPFVKKAQRSDCTNMLKLWTTLTLLMSYSDKQISLNTISSLITDTSQMHLHSARRLPQTCLIFALSILSLWLQWTIDIVHYCYYPITS